MKKANESDEKGRENHVLPQDGKTTEVYDPILKPEDAINAATAFMELLENQIIFETQQRPGGGALTVGIMHIRETIGANLNSSLAMLRSHRRQKGGAL